MLYKSETEKANNSSGHCLFPMYLLLNRTSCKDLILCCLLHAVPSSEPLPEPCRGPALISPCPVSEQFQFQPDTCCMFDGFHEYEVSPCLSHEYQTLTRSDYCSGGRTTLALPTMPLGFRCSDTRSSCGPPSYWALHMAYTEQYTLQ